MAKNQQLDILKKEVISKFKKRTIVFGQGKATSTFMLIGESVNKEEEEKEKLFIGKTGTILNKLLKESGLKKSDFYITTVVKFRPENDMPTPKYIKQSSVFLKQEIKFIEPKLIVALGSVALRGLGIKLPLANIHGRLIRFGNMNLFATNHPSEVIKNPLLHNQTSSDFKKLKATIKEL